MKIVCYEKNGSLEKPSTRCASAYLTDTYLSRSKDKQNVSLFYLIKY